MKLLHSLVPAIPERVLNAARAIQRSFPNEYLFRVDGDRLLHRHATYQMDWSPIDMNYWARGGNGNRFAPIDETLSRFEQ